MVPSCRQSDSLNDIPNAEADRFVASAKCQKVLNESYSFAQKIYQSISVLSAEEREKVSKLCTEIQNTQIYATVEDLLQELQMLMGIDYLGHAYKMKDLSSGIFVNQNFTSEQYAMAIRKYQYLRLSKTQNRVSTKSTDVPNTSDTPLEACIQGCYFAYNRDLLQINKIYFGSALIKNIGNDTLKIFQVETDCGCTKAFVSKKQLLPNDTCLISFAFSTQHKQGIQEEFIYIYANTDSLVHLLKIKSFVYE